MFDPLYKSKFLSSLPKAKSHSWKEHRRLLLQHGRRNGKRDLISPLPDAKLPKSLITPLLLPFPKWAFFLLPPSPIPPSPSSFQHPIFIICCLLFHPPPPRNFTLSLISKVVSRTFCPSFKFIYLNISSSVCQPFLKRLITNARHFKRRTFISPSFSRSFQTKL